MSCIYTPHRPGYYGYGHYRAEYIISNGDVRTEVVYFYHCKKQFGLIFGDSLKRIVCFGKL